MGENEYDKIPKEIREFIPDFLSESDENLRILNEKLLECEEAFKQKQLLNPETLNSLFRAAHSIKGTASFVGLDKIVQLTHKLETVLQKIRDHALDFHADIFDVLFVAFDCLSKLLLELKERRDGHVDLQPVMSRLENVLLGQEKESSSQETPLLQSAAVPVAAQDSMSLAGAPNSPVFLTDEVILDSCLQLVARLREHCAAGQGDEKYQPPLDNFLMISQQFYRFSVLLNSPALEDMAKKMFMIVFAQRDRRDSNPFPKDLFLKSVDALSMILQAVKEKKTPPEDVAQISGKLQVYVRQSIPDFHTINIDEWALTQEEDVLPRREELLTLKQLKGAERKTLFQALDQGYDLFKVFCVVKKIIREKVLKIALIEERLRKSGIVIAIQPPLLEIEGRAGDLNVGIYFCSIENENSIRKILTLDGVEVLAIDRQGAEDLDGLVERGSSGDEAEAVGLPVDDQDAAPVLAPAQTRKESGDQGISILKIDARKIDKLMILSGELVTIRAQFTRLGHLLKETVRQKDSMNMLLKNFSASIVALQKGIKAISELEAAERRIQAGRDLDQVVGSLNEYLQQLKQNALDKDVVNNINFLDETTNHLEKIASEIQNSVMNARMVPIEGVFNRFKRIIRDIAKEVGKDVMLHIEGEETELDKKIVDTLGEPLTHMIRNAVDHGVEDMATRRRLGKSEVGNITLKASHLGNSMCIEVIDDGQGINLDKVVQTAIHKGLINKSKLEAMTEQERMGIIFLPGFSTSDTVTGLSGRGVGMDSVRTMINSLNGMIDIKSEPGSGTTFLIKIPLTLAIIQVLLVQIGGYAYAFPVETVLEIIKVKSSEIYFIDGNPVVRLREHALSLVSLEQVIQIPGADRSQQDCYHVVIVSDGINRVGVVVDELLSKEEIVIKSLPSYFAKVQGVSGASILADGRVALILDIHTIIRSTL